MSTALVSFRHSQAPDRVSSVCTLQDIFEDMSSTLDALSQGLVMVFHTSIEPANDDPVALHDRHHNSDLAGGDMDFLTTSPSQVTNVSWSYEGPTLRA